MKLKDNLDKLYLQEFDKFYQELESNTIEKLKKKGKKLFVKRIKISDELNDAWHYLTDVKITEMNRIPDSYTEDLIRRFHQYMNEDEDEKISAFIIDELDSIKEEHKNDNLSIPENIKLSNEQTVRLIAKWKATELFINHFNSIRYNDDIDICLKKISREGYTPSTIIIEPEQDAYPLEGLESELAKKLKLEFTITRQVLAIKYLFKYAKISEIQYDKTKMAEFMRFLTGRELGASKISNTTIYKKVNNPYKDKDSEKIEDLKYIRKYFSDLNLGGIVDMINEEIES